MIPDEGPRYRFGRIEDDIKEIKASVAAVQASIASLERGMVDRFTPRLEFEQFRREREQRLDRVERDFDLRIAENSKRIDDSVARLEAWDGRLWMGGLMLFVAMATSIFSVLHTIPAPTH